LIGRCGIPADSLRTVRERRSASGAHHDLPHERQQRGWVGVILTDGFVDSAELARRTGWQLSAEGLCRDDVCVPLPPTSGSRLEAGLVAERLGMPLVRDDSAGLWALGPEAGRTLASAVAADFTLPDWRGRNFTLSSLRGHKVLIVAWAPW
jgi:hypothetical protein